MLNAASIAATTGISVDGWEAYGFCGNAVFNLSIGGIPVVVDPRVPRDTVEFVSSGVARTIIDNLAIPKDPK